MAKRRTTTEKLLELTGELMPAACNRLREECSSADVVVVIVATRGKAGEVYIDWGQSNPAAVFGVLEEALANMQPEAESGEEEDDDE
tara:strand:+ start:9101 stop:9361 length:261 start_codon:yes stop_codon:yes gene_type:complete